MSVYIFSELSPEKQKDITKVYHKMIGKQDITRVMALGKFRNTPIPHICTEECTLTEFEYTDYLKRTKVEKLEPWVIDQKFDICGMEIIFGDDIEDIDVIMCAKSVISFGYLPRHGYFLNDAIGRNLYSATMSNPRPKSYMYFYHNYKNVCEMAQKTLHISGLKSECDLLYSHLKALSIEKVSYVYNAEIIFDTFDKLYDPLKLYEATRGSSVIGGSSDMFREKTEERKQFVYRGYQMSVHNSLAIDPSGKETNTLRFVTKSCVEPRVAVQELIDWMLKTEDQAYIQFTMVEIHVQQPTSIYEPKYRNFTQSVCSAFGFLNYQYIVQEWVKTMYREGEYGQSSFEFKPIYMSTLVKPLLEKLFGPFVFDERTLNATPLKSITASVSREIEDRLENLQFPVDSRLDYNRHIYTFTSLLQRFYPEPIQRVLHILNQIPISGEEFELNHPRLGPQVRFHENPDPQSPYIVESANGEFLDYGVLLHKGCRPNLSLAAIEEYLSLDYSLAPKYLSGCYEAKYLHRTIEKYHEVLAGMRAISQDRLDTFPEIISPSNLLVDESRKVFISGKTLFIADNHDDKSIKICAIKNMNIPTGSEVKCTLGRPYVCYRVSEESLQMLENEQYSASDT
jgi:hypothetical protein